MVAGIVVVVIVVARVSVVFVVVVVLVVLVVVEAVALITILIFLCGPVSSACGLVHKCWHGPRSEYLIRVVPLDIVKHPAVNDLTISVKEPAVCHAERVVQGDAGDACKN